ncbi:MAG TPA: hypothetical protein VGL10_02070 [Gammaproteobacteria bacterium]
MFKQACTAIALTLTAGCSAVTAYVPDVHYDYSGEWTLRWLDSNSRHPLSLAQKEHDLSGIYTNSDDVSCSVSGEHRNDLTVDLKIDCPAWDIELAGLSTQNSTVISGEYRGEGNAGEFVMIKHKPQPAPAAAAEVKNKKDS